MNNITPQFWFDSAAEDAVKFYTTLFKNSKIGQTTRYSKVGFEIHGQPEGKVMTVKFELAGQKFLALNGGPIFKFTPAISFLVACSTAVEVETLWEKLSADGKVLMELGEYPFSQKYGWTEDRYGLSWQIMFMGDRPITQVITPTLMYVGSVCGRAEEAMQFYTTVFENSAIGDIMRYVAGQDPETAGTIAHASFTLAGQEFAAMDSAREHNFTFNEAVSFIVSCDTQAEVDYYWKTLSAGGDPAAQQCGWLKDKFGVSWQITPTVLETMLHDTDQSKVERVTKAFLQMKKLDIAALQQAQQGRPSHD